jgi:uncharacterized delta-60 repeat protein
LTRYCPGFLALVAALGASAALSGIELDPTFGNRGVVWGPYNIGLAGLAIQFDGAIVTVGNLESGTGGVALLRFTRPGVPDATFGSGGVATSFISSNVFPRAVAIQSNGRIVITGFIQTSTTSRFFVARYLSNGSLDSSFGTGGFVTTSLSAQGDDAKSVVLQPDGRIVVAGAGGPKNQTSSRNFEVVRYNTDGSLDSSFGSSGSVAVDMDGPAVGIGLRPDGRFVVGGWADSSSAQGSIGLVGLLPNGDLDPAFGSGGQVRTPVDGGVSCTGIALARDGTIVATGNVYASPFPVAVVRYRTDGSLDPSFASGGIFTTTAFATTPMAIAADVRNRVLVIGRVDGSFGLLRLLANGSEDPDLGPQGWTTTQGGNPPQDQAYPEALAIQPDGGIVIGGSQVAVDVDFVTLVRYIDATATVPTLSLSAAIVLAIVLGLAGLLAIQRAA